MTYYVKMALRFRVLIDTPKLPKIVYMKSTDNSFAEAIAAALKRKACRPNYVETPTNRTCF